jgi:hypothetical protein
VIRSLPWPGGFAPKLYDRAELERLVASCGRLREPYPDPDQVGRAGCWRVPLGGMGIRRREALVDEDALPLIAGRPCCWTPGRDGKDGHVTVSQPRHGSEHAMPARGTSDDETSTAARLARLRCAYEKVALRRLILGVSDTDQHVAHANGDPLDCRRANLVVCTPTQRARRQHKHRGRGGRPCSSRFKGASWDSVTRNWRAGLKFEGRHRHFGRFHDELAAAQAYDEAAMKFFGEHARLNSPDGIDVFLAHEQEILPAAAAAAAA